LLFEQAGAMLWVSEAEFISHLIDGQLLIHDVLFRQVDDLVLDVALCSEAGHLLDEITEVACRKAGLFGEIGDGGQAFAFSLSAAEIVLQTLLELQ
jgi:hypothetical protein